MRARVIGACGLVCLMMMGTVPAQEREDRTVLPWEQMRAIINGASGDRAMQHVLELVPYPRVRPTTEYAVPESTRGGPCSHGRERKLRKAEG